jgi:kinesin family protein 26
MGSVGSGTGSGGSSGGSGEEMRGHVLLTANQVGEGETGSSDIDPSSSEHSCDTVIYLGPSIDEATDGEHPPVYLPSLETTEK